MAGMTAIGAPALVAPTEPATGRKQALRPFSQRAAKVALGPSAPPIPRAPKMGGGAKVYGSGPFSDDDLKKGFRSVK